MQPHLSIALLLALAAPEALVDAAGTEPRTGLVVIVSRQPLEDAGLRSRIDALAGGGERLVLALDGDEAAHPVAEGARVLRLAPDDRAGADDRELGRALRAARMIELSGGSFMDWYKTFHPGGRPSRLLQALRRTKSRGTHVVAYGPAASFATGATMIPRSELERPRRNPRDQGEEVAVIGLGLGPPAIVDAEGWQVGELLELLLALWDRKVDLGFFLVGEVALVYESEPHRVRCVGPGRALLFDLDGARRQKRALREARVSLLGDGDHYDFGHARVVPAPKSERRALARSQARAALAEPAHLGAPELAEALAAGLAAPRVLQARGHRMLLRADAGTSLVAAPEGHMALHDAAFDLFWE